MNTPRDEELWKLAKKRANFQRGLVTYFVINAFLWAIWWITIGKHGYNREMPWPLWVMLGWGIGLVFQYMEAYGGNRQNLIDKEYEKLKKQKENNSL